jgi:cytochrome c oxidase subunit 4
VYVAVAVVLAIITAVEVAIYYVPELRGVLVPVLLMLSLAKFSLVVMFFMHLKFDAKLFTGFFISGLLLAISVIMALIALFDNFVPPLGPTH